MSELKKLASLEWEKPMDTLKAFKEETTKGRTKNKRFDSLVVQTGRCNAMII